MNSVTLVGNLGADPDIRTTDSGKQVANLRLCTSERWTDRNGEVKERSEWHNIVVWGSDVDAIIAAGVAQGTKLMVVGKLTTRSYEGREGDKRTVTEVVVEWPRGQIAIVPRSDAQQGGRPAQAGGYTQGRQAERPAERGGYGQQQPAPRGRGGSA